MNTCLSCGKTPERKSYKYCSNKCQAGYQYRLYIENWKSGNVDGSRGISAKNLSNHLRRYLIEKYGERCINCGWMEKHPTTGKVPLEVDHLDGNADNNSESNLRLLCPNCHSLTSNFRNFNKGKGRSWRKAKYLKN